MDQNVSFAVNTKVPEHWKVVLWQKVFEIVPVSGTFVSQ